MTLPGSHSPSVAETGFTFRNYALFPRGCPAATVACCLRPAHTDAPLQTPQTRPSIPALPHWLRDLGRPLRSLTYCILTWKV